MYNGWHDGGWGAGAWIAMGFMMLLFWGIVAAVVVYAIRSSGHGHHHPPQALTATPEDPLRILDERFARGEIDADEYNQRRELLRRR